jgi:recombination protein RecA
MSEDITEVPAAPAVEDAKPKITAKELNKVNDYITKKYGEDIIIVPGKKVDVVSTGSIGLDLAIGIGGLPRGRICDFYGLPSAGKSMLASSVIAQVQKAGGKCVLIDAENGFDEHWASILGVNADPNELIRIFPDTGEQAFDMTEEYLNAGIDLIVIDSTAALVPKEFLERSMEDSALIGLQARMISRGCQKLVSVVRRTRGIVLFIDQVRKKIGTFVGHGEAESPTGGLALEFYSSVRVRVQRKEALKDGDTLLGHKIEVQVKKNKLAPPLKKAAFDLFYDGGIDNASEIFEAATSLGVITKPETGIKYFYKDKSWTGQEKLRTEIKENKELQAELLVGIREKLRPTAK